MIYTTLLASESGSFASPQGDDVTVCKNKKEVAGLLDYWKQQHDLVGSDSSQASIHVFIGKHEDVTDMYPDFIVSSGPRGGCRFTPC